MRRPRSWMPRLRSSMTTLSSRGSFALLGFAVGQLESDIFIISSGTKYKRLLPVCLSVT